MNRRAARALATTWLIVGNLCFLGIGLCIGYGIQGQTHLYWVAGGIAVIGLWAGLSEWHWRDRLERGW